MYWKNGKRGRSNGQKTKRAGVGRVTKGKGGWKISLSKEAAKALGISAGDEIVFRRNKSEQTGRLLKTGRFSVKKRQED